MHSRLSRRQWISGCSAAGLGAVLGASCSTRTGRALSAAASESGDGYNTYFGDVHNHGNVGYAKGSVTRAFEIARNHLDFFAYTPHAHWHDIKEYVNNIENTWINGFAITKTRWPEVIRLAKQFDDPGKFVTLAGYEWHSSSLGDYHILFPDLDAELAIFDDLKEFQAFARKRGCIMVPHHPANLRGHRGANLEHLDPRVSPVLEMFSEWGNAERDRGPFPYIRHSHGGRWTKNTVQEFLKQGHRLGLIASTDDHFGFPGAYRQGLAAIKAKELSREAIFDALRNRRVYAVSGDRIQLDFTLNGRMMGQEVPYARERKIEISVTGWDEVDRIEVLKNNRVIHREFPVDRVPTAKSWEKPVLVRFEYGWGPWPALKMAGVREWDVRLRLDGATLEGVQTCFQSGPLEEDRRDRIVSRDEKGLHLQSHTARRELMEDVATKAVVLKIRGGSDARLKAEVTSPAKRTETRTLGQLAESNHVFFMGPYPRESALIHRVVFNENYETSFEVTDQDDGAGVNWYYVRVIQTNGQMAWSSPIWVEKK